jgi:(p)ppGpp synthase/HD superfamily hydrolase
MFAPDRYVVALRFAAERHLTQKEPGCELPYLVHVTSVAAEVIAALPDSDLAITCALLHDIVEDTPTTLAEVSERFGADVAAGVGALTKNAALPKSEQMSDSLRRIREQPHAIWCVKLADRITNLAAPPHYWTREKCAAYRDEAIAIADALGAANALLHDRLRAKIAAYAAYA